MGGGRLEHLETVSDFCPFRNTVDSCSLSQDFSVKKDESCEIFEGRSQGYIHWNLQVLLRLVIPQVGKRKKEMKE